MRVPCSGLTRIVAYVTAVLALVPGICLAGALMAAASSRAGAQVVPAGSERISGTVTGETGQPLPGVQVTIVDTRLGGVTGDNGRYFITGVAPGTYTLRAQRIGYRPALQSVTVTAGVSATLDFRLDPAPTVLTQQVVVGYTTQMRRDVSDAVSSVPAEDIREQSVATVEEALRGRVPGVQINASGEPGRPAQIIVRGQNFLGNPTPLYVVDGMYLRQNPNLNPNDIESIEVLKDASAAAQYGSQAANGVIVIRTRRGQQADQNRVDLRSYYGMQDVPTRIDMMSAQQWAVIQKQAYDNAGLPVPAGVTAALQGNPAANTNWQEAVFDRGRIQDHNLSFSGATPSANYLISGGFLDQQGSIVETSFRRYSVRVNSDLRRGRVTLGENIALSRGLRQGLSGFPLIDVVRMLPTIPVRRDTTAACAADRQRCFRTGAPTVYGYGDGSDPTFGTNPVGLLERQPRTERSNQVIGSMFGELQLLSFLKYRLNLGINYENYARTEFSSIEQLRMGPPNEWATLREIRNDFTSLLAENLLTFNNQFRDGAHHVNAVGGYMEQRENADDINAFCRGFSDENLRTLDACNQAEATSSGPRRETVLQSWLLRANYTLLDRYLFTGSIRRDGSSRFGPNNRWGTFSAASLGWIVSNERFFATVPWLGRASLFKLRVSTGTLGNQDIGDYRSSVSIDQNRLGYSFGGEIRPGATQLRLANPNIRWQENEQTNLGLDLALLEDRFTMSADMYRSTSKGLLVVAPLPWSLGTGGDPARNPVVNAGSMRNSGTEIGASYRYGDRQSPGFRLTTSATLMTTRNRVLSLGNGGQPLFDELGVARTAVGQPLGTFYLVRTGGVFQSAEEVAAHTTTLANGEVRVLQPGAQPGDLRYIDSNRDGQINDDDRVPMGNGTPKYSGGLFFDGGWGAFDFALNLRGAGGFRIFNAVRYWTDRTDDPSNFRRDFRPWTPENPSRTTPRALAGTNNPNNRFNSDRWLENGGFLRIQNIILGYRLPTSMTQRYLSGRDSEARVYLNLQNVYTFTRFSNWDPETLGFGNPLGRGIDDGRIYPNVRTVSFGIDLRL